MYLCVRIPLQQCSSFSRSIMVNTINGKIYSLIYSQAFSSTAVDEDKSE